LNIKQLECWYSSILKNIYSDKEISKIFEIFSKEYLGYSRVELLMNQDRGLCGMELSKFRFALKKLMRGEPYQYILKKAFFYGSEFLVNKDVLIPRPETEELIELILDEIHKIKNKKLKILDIGTGSGCIAVTLAKYIKNSDVYALDFSTAALKIAKNNAKLHNVEINFIFMNYLIENLSKIFNIDFDIIVSNPPYISVDEENIIDSGVKDFEPKMALFAPREDPLAFYRKIVKDAKLYLAKGGFLFLEINQNLGQETLKLFSEKFTETKLLKDLSGNDRFIITRY